eukprot:1795987-Rhodomonas_salina.1
MCIRDRYRSWHGVCAASACGVDEADVLCGSELTRGAWRGQETPEVPPGGGETPEPLQVLPHLPPCSLAVYPRVCLGVWVSGVSL